MYYLYVKHPGQTKFMPVGSDGSQVRNKIKAARIYEENVSKVSFEMHDEVRNNPGLEWKLVEVKTGRTRKPLTPFFV